MCSLNITTPRNYVCHKRKAAPYYPLQFHLIADADERDFVTGAFARWPIEDVSFIFYDYDLAARYVQAIPDVHTAGVPALVKIAVPEILDGELSKERGINTGILLMDLEKLRRIGWHQLWFETIKGMLRRTSRIRTADQDIYNAIFGMQPQMVYQLSCLWNVQVLRQARSDYCPVAWPVRAANEADCEPLRIRQPTDLIRLDMPKLLHFCGVDKPESETNIPLESFRFASDLRVLGIEELRNTFHRMYLAFRSLSTDCFY
ncbi:hypothetical protein EG68_06184 [Paragonimus skrjabini miyazakii]|uniref:Uncharacterized protein n=1 Tax=Paragonimus skrjabini miyazakii TaxID=59628 RepID=A0A8S9YQ01_9TREM|nr:hypothetical protein EG68_06184 [Paragonimus skrjabini miyazakii]